jgi:uncharacterized protein (TIGR02246 family)
MADRVAAMARDHAAAWCANDPDWIGKLFAEDGTISVNGGEAHVGRAAIIENARALLASFPGVKVHCHETRHAGTRAIFIWTLEGRHAETGNHVTLPGWHEWDLNPDMEVQHCRGFFDASDLERQVTGK